MGWPNATGGARHGDYGQTIGPSLPDGSAGVCPDVISERAGSSADQRSCGPSVSATASITHLSGSRRFGASLL